MYIKDGSSKDYGENLNRYESVSHDLVRHNLSIDEYKKLPNDVGVFVSRHYENLYMWGWLGNKVITSGWKSNALKNKVVRILKSIPSKYVVDHFCGFHAC